MFVFTLFIRLIPKECFDGAVKMRAQDIQVKKTKQMRDERTRVCFSAAHDTCNSSQIHNSYIDTLCHHCYIAL